MCQGLTDTRTEIFKWPQGTTSKAAFVGRMGNPNKHSLIYEIWHTRRSDTDAA